MYSKLNEMLERQRAFSLLVEERIRENYEKGKGEWRHWPPEMLFARMSMEVGELAEAIFNEDQPSKVDHEAADVASMVMMLADAYPHWRND
jgi:NTP pyrophosphatase (non-canonical NTP hydrolase)